MEVDIYIISQPNFGDDRLYRVSQAPKRAWPALSVAFIESSYKRLGTARLGLDSNFTVQSGANIFRKVALAYRLLMCLLF